MGHYTEMVLVVELKDDLPSKVLKALEWLKDPDKLDDTPLIDHPFWKKPRAINFRMVDKHDFSHLEIFHANLKDYENEIQEFLAWIVPYCKLEDHQVVGFTKYEEQDFPRNLIARSYGWTGSSIMSHQREYLYRIIR